MHHLSCKQAARAWEIAPTKATQAGDPAFLKVAQAMLHFPVEATAELAFWLGEADRREFERRELPIREAMESGRVYRGVVHPIRR